jgi:16S rRNA (guanine527-N7)-methyltransferase
MRELILEAASILGRPLDEAALPALVQYGEMVELWNRRMNLTGAKDRRALVDVLFADALVLADEELVRRDAHFVDVGAGAGAPSVPLLLLRGDLRATLVEPLRKRTAFLRSVIGTLDLADRIVLLETSLGDAPLDGGPFDLALSRATFEPVEWLSRARAIAPCAIVMTVEPFTEDGLLAKREYRLPFAGTPRAIALVSAGGGVPRSATRATE